MALLTLLLACGTTEAPVAAPIAAPTASQPDLVIVAVAGLRWDPTARSADQFLAPFRDATEATFSSAYASSPNSYVSLGTVLSGRYPSATPLCGLTGAAGEEPGANAPWCNHWPETVPSLPGVLALYGYRTALATANVAGAHELGKQFQETLVTQETWTDARTDWPKLQAATSSWWAADTTRPRLLVVVTSDLMLLQRPDLLTETGLDGIAAGKQAHPMDRNQISAVYGRVAGELGRSAKALTDALPSDARPRYTVAMGLHGINLADAGVPWQALRDRSWNDLVLDRTLHVPLAVMGPAPTPRQEARIVELVDVFPTFAKLAGAVAPATLPGMDLRDPTPDPTATAYGEFGDMLFLRQGSLLWSLRAFLFNRSSLDPELTNFAVAYNANPAKFYLNDLTRDPWQQQNLLVGREADARRMNTLLLSIRTGIAAPPPSLMDARKVWDLRMSPSEGYW